MRQHGLDTSARHVPSGLVTPDEEQERFEHDLVVAETVTFDFAVHEHADEVVRSGSRADRRSSPARTRRIHRTTSRPLPTHRRHRSTCRALRPTSATSRRSSGGTPQHVADHDQGQRGGKVMAEIALTPFRERVDEVVAGHANARCRGADPRRVNAPLTSRRRFRCAGASMSIIHGSGPDPGWVPPALEKTSGSPSTARTASCVAMAQYPLDSSKMHGRVLAHPRIRLAGSVDVEVGIEQLDARRTGCHERKESISRRASPGGRGCADGRRRCRWGWR